MKPKFTIPFYTVGLSHHLFTTIYSLTQIDFTQGDNPRIMDMYEHNKKYLTSWNLGLQIIYLTLALIHEIILLNKSAVSPKLLNTIHKLRGYIFTTFVLPCTLVVSLYFWIFYHMDKNYVLPAGSDKVVPSWINHSIHTNILLLPLIELALPKIYTPTFRNSFLGLSIFSGAYNTIYLFTYFDTGKWIYPLYEHITWPQRILLLALMYVSSLVLCKLGIVFQNTKPESCDIRKSNYKRKVATVTKKLL